MSSTDSEDENVSETWSEDEYVSEEKENDHNQTPKTNHCSVVYPLQVKGSWLLYKNGNFTDKLAS